MLVEEGADVDDDLLAHIDPALDRCRAHMRHQQHLARRARTTQRGSIAGFALEHVKRGAGDPSLLEKLDQRVLVDDLAARGVDQIGLRLQQPQPPRGEQMDRSRAYAGNAPTDIRRAPASGRGFPSRSPRAPARSAPPPACGCDSGSRARRRGRGGPRPGRFVPCRQCRVVCRPAAGRASRSATSRSSSRHPG